MYFDESSLDSRTNTNDTGGVADEVIDLLCRGGRQGDLQSVVTE